MDEIEGDERYFKSPNQEIRDAEKQDEKKFVVLGHQMFLRDDDNDHEVQGRSEESKGREHHKDWVKWYSPGYSVSTGSVCSVVCHFEEQSASRGENDLFYWCVEKVKCSNVQFSPLQMD